MSTAQISSVQVEGNVEKSLGFSNESVADSGSHKTVVAVQLEPGTECSKNIANITSIRGMVAEIHGPVTLEKLSIKVFASEAGDGVGFVMTRTGGSVSAKNFMTKQNARKMIFTSFNVGTMLEYDVPVPAGLAKQISPVSGTFPGLDLFVKSFGKAEIVIFFQLGIHGDRYVVSEGF